MGECQIQGDLGIDYSPPEGTLDEKDKTQIVALRRITLATERGQRPGPPAVAHTPPEEGEASTGGQWPLTCK